MKALTVVMLALLVAACSSPTVLETELSSQSLNASPNEKTGLLVWIDEEIEGEDPDVTITYTANARPCGRRCQLGATVSWSVNGEVVQSGSGLEAWSFVHDTLCDFVLVEIVTSGGVSAQAGIVCPVPPASV